jgi:hypothetical protein
MFHPSGKPQTNGLPVAERLLLGLGQLGRTGPAQALRRGGLHRVARPAPSDVYGRAVNAFGERVVNSSVEPA